MSMFPQFGTIALPSSISDHAPILISFSTHIQQRKRAPFRYINNWCYMTGYVHRIERGLTATTWGSPANRKIYKLKKVKSELKKWHRSRAADNTITTLQTEFDSTFY